MRRIISLMGMCVGGWIEVEQNAEFRLEGKGARSSRGSWKRNTRRGAVDESFISRGERGGSPFVCNKERGQRGDGWQPNPQHGGQGGGHVGPRAISFFLSVVEFPSKEGNGCRDRSLHHFVNRQHYSKEARIVMFEMDVSSLRALLGFNSS